MNRLQKFPVRRISGPFEASHAVGKKPKFAMRAQFRVEQFNRPCGRVSRILQRLFTGCGHLGLQLGEVVVADKGFTPDLKDLRDIADQLQGNSAHRPGVVGHVVAAASITPRDGSNETTFLVDQRQGDAVNLVFDNPLHRFRSDQFDDACAELCQFGFGKRVIDRQHRHAVFHRDKAVDRRATDFLRGAVGSLQVRMGRFQFHQPPHQSVIFPIGNLG